MSEATVRRMRRAVVAVRWEGKKVALIYATLDAVLALLSVNLVLRTVDPVELPAELPLPAALVSAVRSVSTYPLSPTVSSAILVGVAVGLVVFTVELAVRLRRPLVEQFESVNPEIREALRTARDTAADGTETRMAVDLYEDVLARLRSTSSIGLVSVRRVLGTVVVILLISFVSIYVAAAGVTLGGLLDGDEGPAEGAEPRDYSGLQDPDSVLGDPEDVDAGDNDLDAALPTSGEGNQTSAPGAYDSRGFTGASGAVESQQAGFAERERLEDADLIREYNLKIRDEENES